MLDFRFDGENLFLWIEKNTTLEELKLLLDEKIKSINSFIEEGALISVIIENGLDQADLVPFLLQRFIEKSIKLESIHFKKPVKKIFSDTQLNIKKEKITDEKMSENLPEANNSKSKLIFSSIRSGQVVEHDGDIVIIGNVNLGAEIHGSGNLIVFGDIKGTVKIGTGNPEEAYILSMNLHPNLLQIGNIHSNSIASDGLAMCVIKNGRLSLEPILNIDYIKDYLKN